MVPAQVEKEVLVEAPIDIVWRVLTEPSHIAKWFGTDAGLDGRVGGGGYVTFEQGHTSVLQVEVFEPPHRFAYRWLHEKGTRARPDNSTLVEFTLHAEAGHTRVRVVESGFDRIDWAEAARPGLVDDHMRGWQVILGQLRAYAPRAGA
jgi:uncharacterized protein YndB with AHSA1/START domain